MIAILLRGTPVTSRELMYPLVFKTVVEQDGVYICMHVGMWCLGSGGV